MDITNFKLRPEEFGKIQLILLSLTERAGVEAIFLINRNGQEIAHSGGVDRVDIVALASLAAGSLAATSSLAGLLGESDFERIYLSGKRTSVLVTPAGEHSLLVSLIRAGGRPDLKKLKQAALVLEHILSKCTERVKVADERER
jgi:predicted regulator of Ras-like GTPase activity (Roadblock/LC7/MglB family)